MQVQIAHQKIGQRTQQSLVSNRIKPTVSTKMAGCF